MTKKILVIKKCRFFCRVWSKKRPKIEKPNNRPVFIKTPQNNNKKVDHFLVMFGPGPKKHNKLKEQKLDHLWNDKHQKIENDTNGSLFKLSRVLTKKGQQIEKKKLP